MPTPSQGSSSDPRYQTFSTLADEPEEADHLLNVDYNSLPTYPGSVPSSPTL